MRARRCRGTDSITRNLDRPWLKRGRNRPTEFPAGITGPTPLREMGGFSGHPGCSDFFGVMKAWEALSAGEETGRTRAPTAQNNHGLNHGGKTLHESLLNPAQSTCPFCWADPGCSQRLFCLCPCPLLFFPRFTAGGPAGAAINPRPTDLRCGLFDLKLAGLLRLGALARSLAALAFAALSAGLHALALKQGAIPAAKATPGRSQHSANGETAVARQRIQVARNRREPAAAAVPRGLVLARRAPRIRAAHDVSGPLSGDSAGAQATVAGPVETGAGPPHDACQEGWDAPWRSDW